MPKPTVTRRAFLGRLTATPATLLVGDAAALAAADPPATPYSLAEAPLVPTPPTIPGKWRAGGRLEHAVSGDALRLRDGFAVAEAVVGDGAFAFEARAPKEAGEVQIWAGIRCRDRDSRYVVGLRGGNNDDLYIARYAPDGGARFLGVAPLGFHPEVDKWYRVRIAAKGNRFQVYLGDETTPRLDTTDREPLWNEGGAVLGGGWLPVEFRGVEMRALTDAEAAAVAAPTAGAHAGAARLSDAEREATRAHQRAAYSPVKVGRLNEPRTELPLDGDWLFWPELDAAGAAASPPQSVDLDDKSWHVMNVPDFWTPTLTWLHNETGFPELRDVNPLSMNKGICDRLFETEMARLNALTFDWRATRSAWYRHHIDLPNDAETLKERRFALRFDAVAKVAEIYVNGTPVGHHVGMFGETECDATDAVRPGRNVVAVHVIGQPAARGAASNKVLGVAVTVEVTDAMLHSLPHGMYPDNAGGIWQPVALVVTGRTWLDAVYLKPRLDGLEAEVTVRRHAAETTATPTTLSYVIRAKKDGKRLYESPQPITDKGGNGATTIFDFSTPTLSPALWSPHEPNLYEIELTLMVGGKVTDRRTETFGFRTFEAKNGKLLLNGKPFWLRGGNHFPHALRPNDAALAARFMSLAKSGNVVATRSHTAPFSKTWLRAADEAGMLVSFEGTWPWLMLRGEPPTDDLIQAWRAEWIGMLRTHRNHPSLVLWTVNNEMKFPGMDRKTPDLLHRKWVILDDTMKAMRAADPTRPIVCDSSYVRAEVAQEYADLIKPSGWDDGDIDDAHRYYGWYDQSFFHLWPQITGGETFGKKLKWPGRPLISQEMSTGYARNDDGHPCRFYLYKHYTPQSLVGDEAWENRDPSLFLSRQSFLLKELAETFRRYDRDDANGFLHFAYLTWFRDVWNAKKIAPFAPAIDLGFALHPVMISAEMYGRNLYAGSRSRIRVCIANDDESGNPLAAGELSWHLMPYDGRGQSIAGGIVPTPAVPYYQNAWVDLEVAVPGTLPYHCSPAVLALNLNVGESENLRSLNQYSLTLATREWAAANVPGRSGRPLGVYDPAGRASDFLRSAATLSLSSLESLQPNQALAVPNAVEVLRNTANAATLRRFAEGGGRLLLLDAGAGLPPLFPEQVASYRACGGEMASMRVPESPVFDGLAPLDLAWFDQGPGKLPRACRGVYRLQPNAPGATALADVLDRHGYLKTMSDVIPISGTPLVEMRVGRGLVLASEMCVDAADTDPIAGRLLGNLLGRLAA